MTENGQALATDSRGGEGRIRAGRLTDVDDPRPGSSCLGGGLDRLTPQRIDYQCRPVAAGCLAQPFGQAASVERDGRVGAELSRALEPIVVATRGDDPFGPQQTRDLERNRADGSRRPEDEHAIVGANGCPLGEGQPAGDSGDPARGGDRILDTVRDRNDQRSGKFDALDQEAVAPDAPAVSEQIHARAVETSDRLAAWHVRQGWVASVEAPHCDGEVEGIESNGEDLDWTLGFSVDWLGRLSQLGDLRSAHCGILRRDRQPHLSSSGAEPGASEECSYQPAPVTKRNLVALSCSRTGTSHASRPGGPSWT